MEFPHPRIRHPRVTLPSLPASALDPRFLVVAAAAVLLVSLYAALFSGGPGSTAPQTASAPAQPVQASDPLGLVPVSEGLRALRDDLGRREEARTLLLLGDGTLGTTVVRGDSISSVMARGSDVVREPLAAWPAMMRAPELDLGSVRAIAMPRLLATAEKLYKVAPAQLASLRLEVHPRDRSTFIWTGTWKDPARTTLYADKEGKIVTRSLPR